MAAGVTAGTPSCCCTASPSTASPGVRCWTPSPRWGAPSPTIRSPTGSAPSRSRATGAAPNPYAKESAIAQVGAVMQGLGLEQCHPGRQLLRRHPGPGGGAGLPRAGRRPDPGRPLGLCPTPDHPGRGGGTAPIAAPQPLHRPQAGGPDAARILLSGPGAHHRGTRATLAIIHTRMANWDLAWGALLDRSLSSPVDISDRLDQVRCRCC